MKKFFIIFGALATLFANAQTTSYTDELRVTLNGTDLEPSEATVEVTLQDDGKYTFSLPNFILVQEESSMAIGTIKVTDIEATALPNGKTILAVSEDIKIESGDSGTIWMGPFLGNIPVVFNAVMSEEKVYVQISIDMSSMFIDVEFGNPIVNAYTDKLAVTMNGTLVSDDESTIYVTTQIDGKFTITLKNFILSMENSSMNVGTINITDVEGVVQDDVIEMVVTKDITIESGDEPSGTIWIGPMLGSIPVELSAKLSDTFYAEINLTANIGEINVVFGGDETSGIQSIENVSRNYDSTPYTLQGIKAPANYKGIVIQNGRKVLR